MTKRARSKSKVMGNDSWVTEHFEELVDKFAGRYLLIGNGKILYTDRDGTPGELGRRVRKEYPGIVPLFLRVPYPHEFLCALTIL